MADIIDNFFIFRSKVDKKARDYLRKEFDDEIETIINKRIDHLAIELFKKNGKFTKNKQ